MALRSRLIRSDTSRPAEVVGAVVGSNGSGFAGLVGVSRLALSARRLRAEWTHEACGAARLLAEHGDPPGARSIAVAQGVDEPLPDRPVADDDELTWNGHGSEARSGRFRVTGPWRDLDVNDYRWRRPRRCADTETRR